MSPVVMLSTPALPVTVITSVADSVPNVYVIPPTAVFNSAAAAKAP